MSRYLLYELAGALIHPTKALGDRVHEDNLLGSRGEDGGGDPTAG